MYILVYSMTQGWIGPFERKEKALFEAVKLFDLGTFLILDRAEFEKVRQDFVSGPEE